MQLAALLRLVRYLGEASGDTGSLQRPCKAVASIEASVAPVWRHRFEAHRAAFEHGLQPVDAAIALSQTLGPAEAVGRAVAHAELFEAEPASWRIVDEPKPFGPSAAFWANKVAPRAPVREHRMSDADEFICSPNGMRTCRSSSLITPVALRRDAARLTSSSKKMRLSASLPRFGMNSRLASPATCAVS